MKPAPSLIASLIVLVAATLLLSACGFHLRQSADLPAGMQTVYLEVSGSDDFRRALTRALEASGTTVVDEAGAGMAEMHVPTARFSTDALTVTGQGRISVFAVRFRVRFDVADAQGNPLVESQEISMSREFTYDAGHAIGRGTQMEVLRQSLVQDMVRAVMFRLQAAGAHPDVTEPTSAPAGAASAPPASRAP